MNATMSRRGFVGAMALMGGGCAVGASRVGEALASPPVVVDDVVHAGAWHDQMGFWVDASHCVDCGTCIHACRRANHMDEGQPDRRRVLEASTSRGEVRYVSVSCMHCSNPPCAQVCPARAITKREGDGAVVVDKSRCIGCKYCFQACPFEVPRYTEDGMDKCDFCIENGSYPEGIPACAAACPHDALHFGSIEEMLETVPNVKALTGVSGPSLLVS